MGQLASISRGEDVKIHLTGMTAGMVVGITAAVVLASVAGAYLYSTHHFETLLESARAASIDFGIGRDDPNALRRLMAEG